MLILPNFANNRKTSSMLILLTVQMVLLCFFTGRNVTSIACCVHLFIYSFIYLSTVYLTISSATQISQSQMIKCHIFSHNLCTFLPPKIMSENLWYIQCTNTFSEYNFVHSTEVIIVEYNVATWYGYFHLHTPPCDSLINTDENAP
jgi:hypothetical protein